MAGSGAPSPGRIFISYRRQETAYPAGWLFDRLADHFGSGQVFKDVDSIELGDDFVEVITSAVGSCDVLLALIGDQWLTVTDEDGRPRLQDPGDFVRVEIEAALTRNVRVIPILVEGARMPRATELPASLAKLVRRQALELSPARFDFDTGRLLRVLDKTLAEMRTGEENSVPAETRPGQDPARSSSGERRRRLSGHHPRSERQAQQAGETREGSREHQTHPKVVPVTEGATPSAIKAGRGQEARSSDDASEAGAVLASSSSDVPTVGDSLQEIQSDQPQAAIPADHRVLADDNRANEIARLYRRAADAEQAQDWPRAASEYGKILQFDPHDVDATARRDDCVRQERISELSSRLDHVAGEDGKVRNTVDEPTALDPSGAAKYAEVVDRPRPAPKTLPAPGGFKTRRRVLIAAAAGAVVVAVAVTAIVMLISSGGAGSGPLARTVDIPATQRWTDTHVTCKTGEVLDITATGTIRHNSTDPTTETGPNGDPDISPSDFNRLLTANHGALIGSLNGDKPYFLVGDATTYTCQSAGGLLLGVNDGGGTLCTGNGGQNCLDNNSGKFTATIRQQRS